MKGDCLELMKSIPDGSVDLILTDPPYGTTACKWDSIIPFGPMWQELKRIIKPNGAIVLFGSEPFSSALRMSNIKQYKYDWYWRKSRPSGFAQAKNMPLKNTETISVFSEGVTVHANQTNKRMPYIPQGLIKFENPRVYEKKSYSDSSFSKRPSHGKYEQSVGAYPRQGLDFASESKTQHPTQKPVALLEYLIKTYTKEGEMVLDFTCGSGSTLVAAKNTNRHAIGIELDETYFNIAQERMK